MTCNECDCADPTAIEGLADECACACHLREDERRYLAQQTDAALQGNEEEQRMTFEEATFKLIEWHSDASHAWLRVPVELVEPVKDKVSGFSYVDDEFVYLEEDCDALPFVEHYREALVGIFGPMPAVSGSTLYPDLRYVNDGSISPIRRKPCYVPTENYRSPFSF